LDEDTFAKKPKPPVRPKLGTGNTMWRWVVKAFSRGRAETDAYKEYARKKEQYIKDEKKFQEDTKKFNERYGGNDQFEKDMKLIKDEFDKQLKAKKTPSRRLKPVLEGSMPSWRNTSK